MENPPGKVNYEWSIDLPTRLHLLLKSGEWSDCSFAVGTETTEPGVKMFKAHKMPLSAASPVFRAMFYGEQVDESPIKIVDIRPDIFQTILDFIYTDQVIFETFQHVRDVWYAAHKYIIPTLTDACESHVLQTLNSGNACQIYEMAKYGNQLELMQRCLKIIMQETHSISKSSFEEVQLSTLLIILDSDKLNLSPDSGEQSEVFLYDVVKNWGIAECKRKEIPEDMSNVRKLIEPALRKIRFLTFKPAEFAAVQSGTLLTEEESTLISKNIDKQTTFPMVPVGFSTSRVCRQRL